MGSLGGAAAGRSRGLVFVKMARPSSRSWYSSRLVIESCAWACLQRRSASTQTTLSKTGAAAIEVPVAAFDAVAGTCRHGGHAGASPFWMPLPADQRPDALGVVGSNQVVGVPVLVDGALARSRSFGVADLEYDFMRATSTRLVSTGAAVRPWLRNTGKRLCSAYDHHERRPLAFLSRTAGIGAWLAAPKPGPYGGVVCVEALRFKGLDPGRRRSLHYYWDGTLPSRRTAMCSVPLRVSETLIV